MFDLGPVAKRLQAFLQYWERFMSRKIMIVLMSIVLLVAFMPTIALAGESAKTYKANGMTWELDDEMVECKLIAVDQNFNGTIPMDITTDDGKWYCTAPLIDEIEWNNTTVTKLRIPALVGGANADAFQQASNIVAFEVYPVKDQEAELPILESDETGVLYEMEYDDCEETAKRLVAFPNGKTDVSVFRILNDTTEINQYAFEYCKDLGKINKVQVYDERLFIDLMGAEEPGSVSLDALAKTKDGGYDFKKFSISLANPEYIPEEMEEDEEYATNEYVFEYARLRGISIDASLLGARVLDVKYNKSNKYNPIVKYGDVKLVEGKDYKVDYHQKLKSLGLADISLLGLGDFENTSILTSYYVQPYKVTAKKPFSGNKSITIKWKPDKHKYGKTKKGKTIRVSGYQIAYKKAGTYKYHYKTVKGKDKSAYKVKKLKKNQKYNVKVRSYKKVDYQIVYSPWSSVKTIKVK